MAQKKLKMKWVVGLLFLLFAFLPASSYAASPYVLPYPSYMPGSIFYKPHQTLEGLSKFWHFGNFGKFKYNLNQSDKYLVEAKTLFEYKQYLLGLSALKKSNDYFSKAPQFLEKAENEQKNIGKVRILFSEATEKHIEELLKIKANSPTVVEWRSEKDKPTTINLGSEIDTSVKIRKQKQL